MYIIAIHEGDVKFDRTHFVKYAHFPVSDQRLWASKWCWHNWKAVWLHARRAWKPPKLGHNAAGKKNPLSGALSCRKHNERQTDFQVQFLWAFFVLIFDHMMLFASINKGMSFGSMSAKLRWLIAQLEAACWCKCDEIGE